MDKKEYLDWLWNSFGDFEIQMNWTDKNGEQQFSKRYWWSEKRDNDWWVKRITHRVIFPFEVVLDCDPDKRLSEKKQQKQRNEFVRQLKWSDYNFKLFYTNPNYHAHLIFPELLDKPIRFIRKQKEKIISQFRNCDLQLAGNNKNIACEYSEHWKRGHLKNQVYTRRGYNYLWKRNKDNEKWRGKE